MNKGHFYLLLAAFLVFSFWGCGGDGPVKPGPGTLSGTIIINQNPDSLTGAGWSLSGPQTKTGAGDLTLSDMPLGQYALVWNAVSGYITPVSPSTILTGNVNLTFEGSYLSQVGPTAGYVQVPAGVFNMGSPESELGRSPGEIQHMVTLTTPFEMSATEVTNRQYADLAQWALDNGLIVPSGNSFVDPLDTTIRRLLGDHENLYFISLENGTFHVDAGMDDVPVHGVTFFGAAAYCNWLSLRAGLAATYDRNGWWFSGVDYYRAPGYRLPTEAEWEYACRAGSEAAFGNGPITETGCGDPNLDLMAWYCFDPYAPGSGPQPVAQLQPNAWGLYDMHGNLMEWCFDGFASYPGDVTNPIGRFDVQANARVERGGGWQHQASVCRSAFRAARTTGGILGMGFRPVRSRI